MDIYEKTPIKIFLLVTQVIYVWITLCSKYASWLIFSSFLPKTNGKTLKIWLNLNFSYLKGNAPKLRLVYWLQFFNLKCFSLCCFSNGKTTLVTIHSLPMNMEKRGLWLKRSHLIHIGVDRLISPINWLIHPIYWPICHDTYRQIKYKKQSILSRYGWFFSWYNTYGR